MQSVNLSFIASTALLVAAWLAWNHYPPWPAAHSELLAALSAAALGMNAFRIARSSASLLVGYPAIFFLALALIPMLQLAAGEIHFAGDAWIAFLYLACAALAIQWSAQACEQSGDSWPASLAWALMTAALLSSGIAFVQQWRVSVGALDLYFAAVPPGHAPFANLAQPNLLATLLALGLAAALFLFEMRRISAVTASIVALPMTLALVMTQSRTALLLFAAMIGWHVAMRRRAHLRTPFTVILAFAIGWAALFLAWPQVVEGMDLWTAQSTASRLRSGPRTILWPQLIDAAMRSPWFGYGWNQISEAQIVVAADYPRTRYVESAHNLLLDMALWNGLPLALLIVGIAVFWLLRSAIRVRSKPGAFALLVILLLLAHAMVELPLDYLFFLVPFAFAIGILSHETQGASRRLTVPASANTVALLVFSVVTVIAAVDYWRVEEAFREMRLMVAQIGRPMAESPPRALHTEFTQLAAYHRFALTTPRVGMRPEELEWMRHVSHRYAYAPSLYKYALAQALNGDIDGARLTLLQMKQLHGEIPYAQAHEELVRFAVSKYPALRALVIP